MAICSRRKLERRMCSTGLVPLFREEIIGRIISLQKKSEGKKFSSKGKNARAFLPVALA